MTYISLITATFNTEATLRQCLESVAMQSVIPEHIIVDGCSTDDTLSVAESHDGHRLKIASGLDDGIYDAMNKGIKNTSGDIIGILNADDFYASSYVLEDVLNAFEDPAVETCYGDLCYVDSIDTEKTIRYWHSKGFNLQKFYWGWMPPHPTFFVRRSVYEKYGVFNLDLGSAADYELMLRFLVRHRVSTVYIPKVLVKMRTGGVSNAALKNRLRANKMDRKAWSVNGLRPYPWTLTCKPLRKISQWIFTATPQNISSL
jgi:glycosyltransferase